MVHVGMDIHRRLRFQLNCITAVSLYPPVFAPLVCIHMVLPDVEGALLGEEPVDFTARVFGQPHQLAASWCITCSDHVPLELTWLRVRRKTTWERSDFTSDFSGPCNPIHGQAHVRSREYVSLPCGPWWTWQSATLWGSSRLTPPLGATDMRCWC